MLQVQARALGDPTRHRIFRYIADSAAPVGVAELASEIGVHHNAVRRHLAQLAAAGLLDESTMHGPGRGRPKLVYRVPASALERWVARPTDDRAGAHGPYEQLSMLLAEVVNSGETPEVVGERLGRRAVAAASDDDDPVDTVVAMMASHGFEPVRRQRGDRVEVVLQACPFESAALAAPDAVCALHRGMARAITGDDTDLVARDPRRAGCVLRLPRRASSPNSP